MPSSKKKQTKAQPRLPSSDPRGSSQTPSSLTPSPSSSDLELTEYDLSTALQAASEKYPRLIGKSAFIGRVSEVETDAKGCKIWLSEPSMLASSIAPGSLVSVSLASSSRQIMLGFPLSSFAEECLRNTGTDTGDKMVKEPGNFFALATVFPSSKVFKNGVRLSANLSYTMGCPTSGRALFVYAVQIPDLGGLVNQTNNLQSIGAISVQNCKELCLELASESEFTTKETVQSLGRPPVVKSQNEAGSLASPRTLVCHSKIGSPISGQFSSPTCEGLSSCPPSQKISPFDSFDIVQLLEDEKTKNLLNACTKSWLYSRCLLQGNLVIVPVLSKLWFFRVIGDQQAPSKAKNQCITDDRIQGLSPEVSCLQDHLNRAFVVTSGTNICLSLPRTSAFVNPGVTGSPGVRLQHAFCEAETGGDDLSLGGLDKEYSVLKDVIVSSCVKNTLSRFGLRATKGVLLHGPPGTGKTSLARLCSRDAGVSLLSVNGPEIVSQYYGESEQALRDVFDSACRAAPAVVFIDELDAIAPARREGGDELSQRMVGALLSLMDGINGTDGIFVIAATNRPESVEPALRRPGRFDREIHIGVPSPKQRLEILFSLLSRVEHSLSTLQIQQLAMVTHGFVGADLAALCNEAVLGCIRRYDKFKKSCENPRSQLPLEIELGTNSVVGSNAFEDRRDAQLDCLSSSFSATQASSDNLPCYRSKKPVVEDEDRMQTGDYCSKGLMDRNFLLRVSFEDFEKARTKVRPSAMREVILEVPKVKWEDIGGQREVKAQLMEAVEWPQKHQDALRRLGIHPPRGVLLFGPPGCSKTLLARAVASEAGLNFIAVKGPQLFSKWVGESEKAVKSVFAKARANAPSIIFFDEIDGLAVTRGRENDGVSVSDRVITQLLVELDGLHQRVDVMVIAATNRPDKIDPALLRPGRFDRLLYVGLPNEADREEIFHIHLRKTPCSSDVNVKELAHLTEGCIGADISFICRQATVAAMEEKSEATEVAMKHFKEAIDQVRPSELKFFEELSAQFQRLVLSRDK